MSPLGFACRSMIRQPARALLGIAGIAIVGALLFDMLMLSRGLVLSFEELLDAMGFDVRVTATDAMPGMGPPLGDAGRIAASLRALPEVDEVVPVRFGRAEAVGAEGTGFDEIGFMGSGPSSRSVWTVRAGSGLIPRDDNAGRPTLLVNRQLAQSLALEPGDSVPLKGACERGPSALPTIDFQVAGVVDFKFDAVGQGYAVTTLAAFRDACGFLDDDVVDFFLVASTQASATSATVESIRRSRPELNVFSNRQLVSRFEATDFSYFRQISFALALVTLFFAFLLIATLLTVSVNQRLAEVAALRALGFPRRRVAADLLWESALFVLAGGLAALPLGGLLAFQLDGILGSIPGLPERLSFFVLELRTVLAYGVLLLSTGALAALYPVYLAARLPIAETLRKETVS